MELQQVWPSVNCHARARNDLVLLHTYTHTHRHTHTHARAPQLTEYRRNDLVLLEVRINGEPAEPLSIIVHRDAAFRTGKALCLKLKELIPRQMFKVPIQVCVCVCACVCCVCARVRPVHLSPPQQPPASQVSPLPPTAPPPPAAAPRPHYGPGPAARRPPDARLLHAQEEGVGHVHLLRVHALPVRAWGGLERPERRRLPPQRRRRVACMRWGPTLWPDPPNPNAPPPAWMSQRAALTTTRWSATRSCSAPRSSSQVRACVCVCVCVCVVCVFVCFSPLLHTALHFPNTHMDMNTRLQAPARTAATTITRACARSPTAWARTS